MPEYAVESYLGRGRADEFADAVARARALEDVRWLRSSFVAEDEICLHWFEAPSHDAVREATERARLDCNRIVVANTIERGNS